MKAESRGSQSSEPDMAAGAAVEGLDGLPLAWTGSATQPVLRSCSYGGSFCEVLVVEAIQEYASFHNMQATQKALSQALRKLGLPGTADDDEGPHDTQAELCVLSALQSFGQGLREPFIQLWRAVVPSTPNGLELRLHVHFGIYKMRKALERRDPGPLPELDFSDLKAFLSSRPSGDAPSLSSLFALPFVPRPHENSALRFIFEDSWLQELRRDVQAMMTAHASTRHAPSLRHMAGALASRCKEPPPASWHELLRITELALNACSQALSAFPNAEGPDLSDREAMRPWLSVGGPILPQMRKQASDLRRRFDTLARHPELPAPETAGSIGLSDWDGPVLQDRLWTREALRGSSASSLGASHSAAAKRLHSARSIESRARTATALLPVPPALDFGRIAALLSGEAEENLPPTLSVLRAVLRRLALPDEAIRPRRAFLAAFACFGALGALAAKLPQMIHGDQQTLEMVLAVMAVCSCEVVGRREIEAQEAQGSGCISALVSVVSSSVRSLTHMHCLAVLQRLSLRGRLQSKMIGLGVLDVVLKLLESVRKPEVDVNWCRLGPGEAETPDFSIEFTSALLMNLTLRSAGRKRCAELGAYNILVSLIEHPNAQVRTHINGTLYTLLGVKAIRSEAQKRGAEAVFLSALERVSENELLQRQLEFLLHQLQGDIDSDAEESDEAPEPEADSDADDGDNFLDEEELAAHFHLASTSAVGPGDGYSQADIDANTKAAMAEAAAAEEVLRCFRATGAVADSQQRRFAAFIARSCRNLISPKRRNGSSERLASPLSPVIRSPASESKPTSQGPSEPRLTVTHDEAIEFAASEEAFEAPKAKAQPAPPVRGTGASAKAAEVPKPRAPGDRPESRHEETKGRGRAGTKGRGRGKGQSVEKSSSLPPLPENKASGRTPAPASSRTQSEAPKRVQQAKAAIEVASAIGQESGFRKRHQSKPPERQSSKDAHLPQLPKRR